LERATNRYVDQFIVVSDFLKKEFCRLTSIRPDKVIRIYNGVETGIYSADARQEGRRRIREEFSLGEHDMVVGAIGRLVWQKGFKHLLKCLPDVLSDASQIKTLLVGEGPLRAELESLSKELGVQQSVIFAGERRDIPEVLAAIDIMVVPSVLEGFPMVTLEAMAMEKPIVATAIPGITEQITNGKEGLLVPPDEPVALANAILRIANDPYFAQELGRVARRRVESEFSIEQMVELTMKTYEKLLSTGNRDGRK
jgi:glycosyltransferase involved in cell wall biosynthesis